MAKILDDSGLERVWSLINDKFSLINHTHSTVTTSESGFMSTGDKSKLDNLESTIINSVVPSWKKYEGGNIVFFGDSYTYGTGASDHLDGDTKRFSSLLASKLGMTEYNFGVGSTGFCDPGSGGQNKPFPTQVSGASSSMTSAQKSATRIVVIAGGINDVNEGSTYSGTQMRTAANTTVQLARSAFPNADIFVFPMFWKGWGFSYRALNFANQIAMGVMDFSDDRALAINGVWTWNFGWASSFTSDKLHPNDQGHAILARRCFETIISGGTENYADAMYGVTFTDSSTSATVADRTYGQFLRGIMYFGNMHLNGNYSSGTTTIGTLPKGMVPEFALYAPVYKGNAVVGCLGLAPSGNMNLILDSAVSNGCYIGPLNYIPYGSELS